MDISASSDVTVSVTVNVDTTIRHLQEHGAEEFAAAARQALEEELAPLLAIDWTKTKSTAGSPPVPKTP